MYNVFMCLQSHTYVPRSYVVATDKIIINRVCNYMETVAPKMNKLPNINNCSDLPVDKHALLSVYETLSLIDDPVWLEAIDTARELKAPKNTTLMNGNLSDGQFMLILAGTVRIYKPASDGREITLYRVRPGDLCILSLNSLYQNIKYNVIAKSETDIYALSISQKNFSEVINKSKNFRDFVLSTLNKRLCDLMCLVQDTAFENLSARMETAIKNVFIQAKNKRLYITHQHLAHELGTTREVISRILKDFEKKNIISLHRGYIEIINIETFM